jgi:hypothetical protein
LTFLLHVNDWPVSGGEGRWQRDRSRHCPERPRNNRREHVDKGQRGDRLDGSRRSAVALDGNPVLRRPIDLHGGQERHFLERVRGRQHNAGRIRVAEQRPGRVVDRNQEVVGGGRAALQEADLRNGLGERNPDIRDPKLPVDIGGVRAHRRIGNGPDGDVARRKATVTRNRVWIARDGHASPLNGGLEILEAEPHAGDRSLGRSHPQHVATRLEDD